MNKELEVINAVCTNKDISSLLADGIDDLFVAYGDVWTEIKEYYGKYRTVPDISVLQNKFDVDEVEVRGETPYYLDELRESYLSNRIDTILLKASDFKERSGSAKTLEKLNLELSRLNRFTNNVRDLDVTDFEAAEEHYENLKDRVELNGGVPGILSGFASIDSAYHTGFAPGHLIYAIGYSGRTKSWFTELQGIKFWEQGKKVMIISLEMTPENMRDRIYTMMGSGLFRASELSRGEVNMDNYRTWSKKKFMDSQGFVIVSNEGMSDVTPSVVQGKIDQYKPDVVIWDYAQLSMDNAKTGAMTPRMMNLSNETKKLATRNNIPIIMISAVTDEESSDRSMPPTMSQIAWSRAMEYNADLAYAIHKHDDSDLVEVVCRKNRHGDLFDFFFDVDIDRGIWTEKHDL